MVSFVVQLYAVNRDVKPKFYLVVVHLGECEFSHPLSLYLSLFLISFLILVNPYRYSGRTQKQIIDFVRENYVKRQNFQR